jgi:CRP/FNR family transcriptional regulator, cyclic AMP receptor protein
VSRAGWWPPARRDGGWPPPTGGAPFGTLGRALLEAQEAGPLTLEIPVAPRFRSVFADADALGAGWQRPVRVFEHDRGLVSGLDADAREVALHHGVADSLVLEEGRWTPPARSALGADPVGVLVLDGLLSRTLSFDGLHSPELLGAGELLRPWGDDGGDSLTFETEWRVLERATVALLDDRFARRMARYPTVMTTLLDRGVQRARWLAAQIAIAHVRRAEPRLLMLFWHLADRWGRVTPHGVDLPLRLTHTMVAHLACMRRPTVSATIMRLARAGELRRNGDGTWLLTGAPPDVSAIVRREAAVPQRAA